MQDDAVAWQANVPRSSVNATFGALKMAFTVAKCRI